MNKFKKLRIFSKNCQVVESFVFSDEGLNFEQQNLKMADVSNSLINERLNIERPYLRGNEN